MKKRTFLLIPAFLIIFFLIFFSGYSAWNAANPEKTCASCHEINPSHETWQMSSHREISCLDCHGTAMSNGFHSLKEKSSMIFTHISKDKSNNDIRLSEKQIIETMDRCTKCHQEEYKKWISGGHSANYSDIFLNEEHNSMEQLYWDCFRCHGMFFEGTIYDLIKPVSNKGPWEIIDPGKKDDPVIPCLSCHEIHSENEIRKTPDSMSDPKSIFYDRKSLAESEFSKAGLYIRADKIFLRADHLPEPEIIDGTRNVETSENHLQRICIQCHAPNYQHQAGSQDDRTPSGVHEGLACMACHETHSNDATNSCKRCHPVINNCGLDHTIMNTSYFDKNSTNNIHHVKCIDCHVENDKRLNRN